jgi:serine/threonine-protein kinase
VGTLGGIPVEVGDVLAKKYRLERLVGEGGTGVVVAARHLQLEQRVAIKFLRTALASEEIRMRFEREARAIGKIESEHVVLVYDVGALEPERGGEPYMVMEYLEGRDLARILKEDGALALEDAVDCMLQVCDALAEAHANGIVHRDLKPGNLFLTHRDDGGPHIKVVDFGISKILDKALLKNERGPKEMTGAFEVLGSPRYMAPEQLRNSKAVDFRADLWSVGAVLFQLVSGRHAFGGESNIDASLNVLTKEPELLTKVSPHAPKELEAIVSRCLTKDVTKRWQSARELADALRPFASDRTRDSLERMEEAREAPSLNIALDLASLTPAASEVAMNAPPMPKPPPPPKRPPPAPGTAAATPQMTIETGPSAFKVASIPPGAGPSSLDAAVSTASRRAFGKPNTMKLVIVAGGIGVVLLAFGAFTALRLVFHAVGSGVPEPDATLAAPALPPLPATAVTAPPPPNAAARAVPLEAGRPHP